MQSTEPQVNQIEPVVTTAALSQDDSIFILVIRDPT
jgi:hypothetical protein